nr:integrase, catalytic region, zinc finger, CCHC-type, peptidase aspartic, catalytic [Tanacetum cinerariifolium]
MLNKDNYVPWSSRLLRYAKIKPNGKFLYNSITHGPYVRRMIHEPGDPDREMEADEQVIQTILMGIPEDIYAAVDSCETAQEIWLCIQQMIKGYDVRAYEKKAKLFNERERFTSTDGELLESYYNRFSNLMNDFKRNKHFSEKIANESGGDHPSQITYTQQPPPNNNFVSQPSFNTNYMQQPMLNPDEINDPTITMSMALVLMAKAVKLNYFAPTNDNQKILSNHHNRQIAQPGMNMVGGNKGNKFRQYAGQNVNNQIEYNVGQFVRNQNGTCQGNGNGNNGNQIRCYNCRRVGDIEEIEKVNAKCILMANLQQASLLGTQADKALVYDSNGSAKVIKIFVWCVDSGCSKHMTGNLKLLINFVWKFMGTIRFGKDHVAAILGVYNQRTKKIIEMINVTFDELSAMDFEQRSSKPGLQGMTSG